MKILFTDRSMDYTGEQLAPHWIYRNFNILGDAMVAFSGAAQVSLDHMVDLADVLESAHIYSPLMLHFLVEHFDTNLELAVYRQRMLIVAVKEELEQFEVPVTRFGDDLYVNRAKLSVSIATSSVVSTLIHVGLNIQTEGTPVKTVGLTELGISDIKAFAENVMLRYKKELEQIYQARCKVRGIGIDC
ncbi:DUF366 family protein [Syntrophomonas erecta]